MSDEFERAHRRIIRDEALAHIWIETILEEQQIEAGREEARRRIRERANAWDQLTAKDMTWWPHR